MAEEIIFRIGADTAGAQKGVDELDADVKQLGLTTDKVGNSIEKQFADIQKRVASGALTQRELTKAVREYQTIALQAGEESPIGQQAISAAGQLTDRLGDLQAQIRVTGHDGANMQAALQLGQTVLAGYSAFQGITALVGQENEELMQTLVKLQGVESALVGIEQIRAALEAESFLMIKANTIAQQAYNVVVGESVGAMKALRLAFAAIGIGALIAGVIYLISVWDDLTGATSDAALAQEALTDTLEDYKKGATDAATETSKVKTAFDLAREGVISKEEALQTYNETLGESFGRATDLNEAERLFTEKTDAYIKAAALRAQANALLAKAAEEQANALTAGMEDQTTVLDNASAAFSGFIGGQEALLEKTAQQQKQRVKEAEAQAKRRNNIFTEEAERLLKEAELTENTNGIKSESEQKLAENREKIAQEAADKAKERREQERQEELKRQQELQRLQREFTDLTIAGIAERGLREQMQLAENHRRQLEDLRAQFGERADLIRQMEENQELERRALEIRIQEQDKIDRDALAKEREEERKKEADAQSNFSNTLIELMQKNAAEQKQIDDAIFQSKLDLANNLGSVLGAISTLARENSATQKALAITEIAIQTATGFMDGLRLAQKAALETPTPVGKALVFASFAATQFAAVINTANKVKGILGAGASVSPPTASMSAGGSSVSGGITPQIGSNTTTDTNSLQNPTAPIQPVLVLQSLKQASGQFNQAEELSTYP